MAYGDIESILFNGSAYAFSTFADSVSPTLVSSTPADDAQSVALASNIILVFSENIKAGVGNFVLSNGVDVRLISVTDTSQVYFAGANVTINPLADLVAGSSYSLQFAAGVIQDAAGNSFAGILNATTLNFSTIALPQLAIVASDTTKSEGNSANTDYTFTVSRTGDTTGISSVTWAVTGSGVNGASGSDFVGGAFPSGTVEFAAGESSKIITVLVAADTIVEGDEAFVVTLSGASNGTITTAVANGTINNDDVLLPELSIAATDAVKPEENSGIIAYTFTVSRTGDASGSSIAYWAVSGSGANPASGSGAFPSGTVEFAAGESSKIITVLVAADTVGEADETFAVTLSGASNATISTAVANGTINNDDPLPQLVIAATDAVKAEGDSGTTGYSFTVSRTGDLTVISSAAWAVSGSGANPASGSDFEGGAFPSGTVEFAAGESSKIITVLVAADTVVEANETFAVTLGGASNAMISTASASGTIHNDDTQLAIVASSATKVEGNSGSTAYTFMVSRSGDLSVASSAAWAVTGQGANGASASDFVDNTFPSGTLTFATGESSKTITVNVNGDSTVEFDEDFTVSLSNTSNATITTASASGTILNDDTAAPLVTQVSTLPSDGILAIGATVRLTVVFSSDVFVTEIPALNLANGGVATYSSGSGTTSLNFTYVVNASNISTADLTTAGTNAISLPGEAAISNLLGTAAVLSGANAVNPAGILAVDTILPVVTSMAVNGNTVILSFSEAVKGTNLIAANFSRQIGTTAAVSASAISLDVLSNKVTLTFTGTAPASNSAVKVTYAANSGIAISELITDQAGNSLTVFSNQVVDTYQSVITVYTLGDGGTGLPATSFTNLELTGTSAVNGTGNALANTITGNSAANRLNGNAGIDTISGLAGADSITGGAGLDTLSGGADADSFLYTTLTDGRVGGTSTARTFESITDFEVGLDRIDAPGTTVRNVKVLGAVTALTNTAIGALLNATPLGDTANFAASGASTFTFGTGATMRTFLAINNGTAAYSTTADAIVDITGYGLFNGATSLANLSIS
ncbi:MAG: Ig-like domain-containing protein [Cyanobacteria bacterium]|nr:Ig-like domain-containing protein [Cyanobacteriota bacterium]